MEAVLKLEVNMLSIDPELLDEGYYDDPADCNECENVGSRFCRVCPLADEFS